MKLIRWQGDILKINMSDNILKKTLSIVFSSARSMPAYFCSNGDRTKSLCIDSELLGKEEDKNMSAQAWGATGLFLGEKSNPSESFGGAAELGAITKCGEDIMAGAFFVTKLKREDLIDQVKKSVIDHLINIGKDVLKNIENIYNLVSVRRYFDYCADYGKYVASPTKENATRIDMGIDGYLG